MNGFPLVHTMYLFIAIASYENSKNIKVVKLSLHLQKILNDRKGEKSVLLFHVIYLVIH